jgi:hypothetical protein
MESGVESGEGAHCVARALDRELPFRGNEVVPAVSSIALMRRVLQPLALVQGVDHTRGHGRQA